MFTYSNLNQASIGLSRLLLHEGKPRKTRGFDCIEIDEPLLICIENPTDRYINIRERKWSKILPFIESLWIASGTNHMELVEHYVPNMKNFSDNGSEMRAAYGTRIRAFSGVAGDYCVHKPEYRNVFSGSIHTVDQLKFVIDILTKDIESRQALITIVDPGKDLYEISGDLKITKDVPCCRTLQFMMVDGKLNCTLTIRSNDLLWGLQSVNVFNFTWMQEYIANILGVPVGKYYHFVNNLHFYEDKRELIEIIASQDKSDYQSEFGVYQYKDRFNFTEFDNLVTNLFYYEESLRKGINGFDTSVFQYNPMFSDWSKVIFKYHNKQSTIKFENPYLNRLYYGNK